MEGIADRIITAIAGLSSPFLLLAVFLLGVGESAIGLDLVIPGEVGMVVAGAAGARVELSLVALIAVGSLGAFLGDSLSYLIGRRFGRPLLCRWDWVRRRMEPKVDNAQDYFDRHGAWTIVLGRWVGALRAVVPFAAGLGQYPYGRFALWNAPTVIVWCTTVITIGYVFGEAIADVVDRFSLILSVTVVTGLVGWWWFRRRRARSAGELTGSGRRASR